MKSCASSVLQGRGSRGHDRIPGERRPGDEEPPPPAAVEGAIEAGAAARRVPAVAPISPRRSRAVRRAATASLRCRIASRAAVREGAFSDPQLAFERVACGDAGRPFHLRGSLTLRPAT
jgi:hypothetical protein